ncbi:MAG: phage minor head protein [Candidatus Colwellbacteria bacterium]|nr:phage minor head protein [Candidatus Colwellbacteria bacterium]
MAKKGVPDKIADSIIKNQIDFDRFSEGIKGKVIGILNAAQQEIMGQIAKVDPDAPTLTKWKQARLETLNQRISEIIDQSYGEIGKVTSTAMKQIAEEGMKATAGLVNTAIGANIFDVTLTPELLNSIATKTMIDGNIIGSWWEKQKNDTKQKLAGQMNKAMQELQIGMVKGESIGELIGRIRGTALSPGVMSISKREAAALVRTSTMQVLGDARKEIYRQNEDVLSGYEIVATLDARTTPLCRSLDRKQYDLNFNPISHGIPYPVGGPPFHWNCRTTLIPITKSYRELMDDKSPLSEKKKNLLATNPVGMRVSMGGPIQGKIDYNEWLLEQTEDIQKEVLGNTRWQLWKDNKLAMSDMIHQDGRPLTIAQLKESIGKGAPQYRETKFLEDIRSKAATFDTLEDFQMYLDTMPENQLAVRLIGEAGENPVSIYNKAQKEVAKIAEEAVKYTWDKIADKTLVDSAFQKFGVTKVSGRLGAVNPAGEEMARLYSKYPALSELATKKGLNELIFVNDFQVQIGASGSWSSKKYVIKVAAPADKKFIGGALKKGGYSACNDTASVLRHELGHYVDKTASLGNPETRAEWKTIFKGHSKDWWKANVSNYSATDMYEAFAESFSLYTNPKYIEGFLPKDIETYFAKLLKNADTNKLIAAMKKVDEDFVAYMKMSSEEMITAWKESNGVFAEIYDSIPGKDNMTPDQIVEAVKKKESSHTVKQKYWKESKALQATEEGKKAYNALSAEGSLPGDYKLQVQALKGKIAESKITILEDAAGKAEAAIKAEAKKLSEQEMIWKNKTDKLLSDLNLTIQDLKSTSPNIEEWLVGMKSEEGKYNLIKGTIKSHVKIEVLNDMMVDPNISLLFKKSPTLQKAFETTANIDEKINILKEGLESLKASQKSWENAYYDMMVKEDISKIAKNIPNIGDDLAKITDWEDKVKYLDQKIAESKAKETMVTFGGKKTYNLSIPEEKKQFESIQNAYMQKYKAAKVAGTEPTAGMKAAYESLTPEQKELWNLKIEKSLGKIGATPKPGIVDSAVNQILGGKETIVDSFKKKWLLDDLNSMTDEEMLWWGQLEKSQKIKYLAEWKAILKEKQVVEEIIPPKKELLDFDNFVKYADQKGSNTGGFYYSKTNSADRYYIKIPENTEIARNEVLASKLYQAAGVEVPELQFIQVGDRVGIASRIIDDVVKIDVNTLQAGAIKGIGDGFVVDAWLGDWDVVGMTYDNLLQKGGRAVRIDVGGSLRFRAQGIAKGSAFGNDVIELKTMRDGRSNAQAAKMFKHIKKGELDEGAKKVLSISDDQIRKLVAEFGPTNSKDADALADILIKRRESIAQQFPHLKVNQITEKVPEPKFTGAINELEHRQIIASRGNGYAIDIDKEDIEDHNILFWTEKTREGNRTLATMKVRGEGADNLNKLIRTTAAQQKEVFLTGDVYDDALKAIKGTYIQIKNGTGLREIDIERARKAVKTYDEHLNTILKLSKEGKISVGEIDKFKTYYADHIKFLREVAVHSTGDKLTLPAYANKTLNRLEQLAMIEKKVKVVEEPAIKFEKVSGTFEKKEIKKGHLTAVEGQSILDFQYYYEATIDNVKIRYWPSNDSSIAFAHKGKLDIISQGADQRSIDKIIGTLKKMGITTDRPTSFDDEILYLKQIIYQAKPKSFNSIVSKVTSEMSQEQAVQILRKEASKACEVTDITKMREYNPAGNRKVFDQGFILRERPDLIESKEFQDFRKEYVLSHSITNHKDMTATIEDILNSGGNLVATTNKLRIGMPWGGMSPSSDMESGGASYVFTRIRKMTGGYGGGRKFIWDTDLLRRLDSISYDSDNYGRVTGNHVADNRISGVKGWIRASAGGSNETIFKNSLSIFDRLKYIVCNSDQERKQVIDMFKKHGYNTFPDGRALIDVIKTKS